MFVEVKARRGDGYGAPAEAVTRAKRSRLERAARVWLALRGGHDRPCRFDVVEVRGTETGPLRCRHVRDAFRLTATG